MMDTERQSSDMEGCVGMSSTARTALQGYNLHTTLLIIYSTHLLHK